MGAGDRRGLGSVMGLDADSVGVSRGTPAEPAASTPPARTTAMRPTIVALTVLAFLVLGCSALRDTQNLPSPPRDVIPPGPEADNAGYF